jgi:hypothetical protein
MAYTLDVNYCKKFINHPMRCYACHRVVVYAIFAPSGRLPSARINCNAKTPMYIHFRARLTQCVCEQHEISYESSKRKCCAQSPTAAMVPNMTMPTDLLGSRSMIMLNVNQLLARANQEKINENKLYYSIIQNLNFKFSLMDEMQYVQGPECVG